MGKYMTSKEDPKYIGNIIVNHKVEQFVRAIVLPHEPNFEFNQLNVRANTNQLLFVQQEFDIVRCGLGGAKGWRFHPSTNSILISWGYNPDAVLLRLNSMVIEDTPPLIEDGSGVLTTTFGSLVALAYECTYKRTYKRVFNDYVKHCLDHGQPQYFASAVFFNNKVKG